MSTQFAGSRLQPNHWLASFFKAGQGRCHWPGFACMNAVIFLRKPGVMAECSWECAKRLALRNALGRAVAPWRDKHLDLETEEFRDKPSTGENIVRALWPKIDNALQQRLVRLRLWETANNRFTVRRT